MSDRPDDSSRNQLQDYLNDRRADNPVARRQAAASRLPTIHHSGIPVGGTYSAPGTSMLLSGNTSLPAMTTAQTLSSSASASSSTGLRPVQPQRLLVPHIHGGLRVPPAPHRPIFDCPFDFLSCQRTFSNKADWNTHSRTHFDGIEPPRSINCRFCDQRFQADTGSMCWYQRMEHTAMHHTDGARLAYGRPDFEMHLFCWQTKILSNEDYRDLHGYSGGRASTPQPNESPPLSPTSEEGPGVGQAYSVTHRPGDRRREDERQRQNRRR